MRELQNPGKKNSGVKYLCAIQIVLFVCIHVHYLKLINSCMVPIGFSSPLNVTLLFVNLSATEISKLIKN